MPRLPLHAFVLHGGNIQVICCTHTLALGVNLPAQLVVIKSTQQSDAIDPSKRTYSSIVNTASKIYKQGGVASFYRGFLPCMLRATPANGIMLMTVDKVRNLIDTM